MMFYPCIDDIQGRIVVKVGTMRSFTDALEYLKAKYPEKVSKACAAPQPHDHPGLVEHKP